MRTAQRLALDTIVHADSCTLTLSGDGARQPAAAAYVKVFAHRRGAAAPAFHKDGYTDVRGKFDYASVTSGGGRSGGGVERYAMLVASPAWGSVIEEAPPPPSG